jgi:release factor glutamine methyltransferase
VRQGERSWTELELLQWTTDHFSQRGIEGPRLDAEVLLAHALEVSRLDLYLNHEKPVLRDERARFRELVRRRAQERVPVSQLLGRREFWSLDLIVDKQVLTPRPETELLVSAALDRMPEADRDYRILDVGTGSGGIALALAHERPKARVTATDVSAPALKIARLNADKLHLIERVRFVEGNLLEAVPGEVFDLVISNPPYLARSERKTLPPELNHEPDVALFGGEDGYAVLEPLVNGVRGGLTDGGFLLVEIDPRQADTVMNWCRAANFVDVAVLHDLAGHARVLTARRGSGKEGRGNTESG